MPNDDDLKKKEQEQAVERRRRARERAATEFRKRLDWMIKNNRHSAEMGKAIELWIERAESFVTEDSLEAFYDNLAKAAEELKQNP